MATLVLAISIFFAIIADSKSIITCGRKRNLEMNVPW